MEKKASPSFETVWLQNIKEEPVDLPDSEEKHTLSLTESHIDALSHGDSTISLKEEPDDLPDLEEKNILSPHIDTLGRGDSPQNADFLLKPSLAVQLLWNESEEPVKTEIEIEENEIEIEDNSIPEQEYSEFVLNCKRTEDLSGQECGASNITVDEQNERAEHRIEEETSLTEYVKCKSSSDLSYSVCMEHDKPYKCNICGKSFKWHTYVRHLRSHFGEKPFKCEVCGKSFTGSTNLTSHMRTHTGEKPFQCGVCNKCFSASSSLVTHIRSHTGEKPYKCDVCGKCFSLSAYLINHKRTHTGEKPFKCEVCGKCFSEAGNLRKHRRTHM